MMLIRELGDIAAPVGHSCPVLSSLSLFVQKLDGAYASLPSVLVIVKHLHEGALNHPVSA